MHYWVKLDRGAILEETAGAEQFEDASTLECLYAIWKLRALAHYGEDMFKVDDSDLLLESNRVRVYDYHGGDMYSVFAPCIIEDSTHA